MPVSEIPVILLAGGSAMRINNEGKKIPLPLLPLCDSTLIDHVIHLLEHKGFRHIYLYVSHLKEQIISHIQKNTYHATVDIVKEDVTKGNASAFLLLKEKLPQTFFVVYVDTLFDLDVEAMLAHHRKKNVVATMAVTELKNPERYGTVSLLDGFILAFYQKMSRDALKNRSIIPPYRINAGYYIFEKQILDFVLPLANQNDITLEFDLFPPLVTKHLLGGYVDKGNWLDASDAQMVEQAQTIWCPLHK